VDLDRITRDRLNALSAAEASAELRACCGSSAWVKEMVSSRPYSNIDMLLNEAGARMEDVCKIVVYLTDVRHRDTVYQVMGRWMKDVYPCSTGVVIDGLARPEWVVEIDATAVIPVDRLPNTPGSPAGA